MIKSTEEQLLEKINVFADSAVICRQLDSLAKELTEEIDYSPEKTYWIKEAQENLYGMFELLMDIKKQHLLDNNDNNDKSDEEHKIFTIANLNLSEEATDALKVADLHCVLALFNSTEVEVLKAFNYSNIRNRKIIFEEIKYALENLGLFIGCDLQYKA
jgi:DNA-directed RNA polymerase alpha subunit